MNPLFLRLIPFAVSAAAGFAIAWWIQSLRVTGAEQEFVDYKQDQVRIVQEQKDAADKQRDEAAKRFSAERADLAKEVEAGDVWKRCVMAGRCSVPRNPSGVREPTTRRAGNGLSAPSRVDVEGKTAISSPGEPTAQGFCEGLANDAAEVQLQLNHLQADIEAQQGYRN